MILTQADRKQIFETKKKMINMLIVEWEDTINMMQSNIKRYKDEIKLFSDIEDPANQRIINSRKRMIELATSNIELAEIKINELKRELAGFEINYDIINILLW